MKATWQKVLNEIYNYSSEQYWVDFIIPLHKGGTTLIEPDVIYRLLEEDKIILDNHPLTTKLGIKGSTLRRDLIFLISNQLIFFGQGNQKENTTESILYTRPLNLTKRAFELAIENQKQKKEGEFRTANIFLSFTLVVTTIYTFFNNLHLTDPSILLISYLIAFVVVVLGMQAIKKGLQ
jgi:hypothetical protein